jgi:hypothetical protein
MLESAISLTFGLLTVAWVLNLYRLVIGPSLPDRVLALDTMYINSIALIVVYGIYLHCAAAALQGQEREAGNLSQGRHGHGGVSDHPGPGKNRHVSR